LPSALKLRILELDHNKIGDEGARALAEALPHAPKLEELFLAGNGIGDKDARALAKVLRQTKNIKKLVLTDSNISVEAKKVQHTAWIVRCLLTARRVRVDEQLFL